MFLKLAGALQQPGQTYIFSQTQVLFGSRLTWLERRRLWEAVEWGRWGKRGPGSNWSVVEPLTPYLHVIIPKRALSSYHKTRELQSVTCTQTTGVMRRRVVNSWQISVCQLAFWPGLLARESRKRQLRNLRRLLRHTSYELIVEKEGAGKEGQFDPRLTHERILKCPSVEYCRSKPWITLLSVINMSLPRREPILGTALY